MRPRALLVGLVAALALGAPAGAATLELPLPKAFVADAVDEALGKLELRLDSYGEPHVVNGTLSWYADGGSVVRLLGEETRFSLPSLSLRILPTRLLRFYVDDLVVDEARVAMPGSTLDLTATFESAGDEVVVRCIKWTFRSSSRWKRECSPAPFGGSAQIDGATLTARLVPEARGGGIAYAPSPAVSFAARVDVGGVCSTGVGFLDRRCDGLFGGLLRRHVEGRVRELLGSDPVRDLVAVETRRLLAARGVDPAWQVVGLRVDGDEIVVGLERP
ncbi:MAG: hypothetical protein R3C15_14460 [Thermoleophilia bacterium]